MSIDKKEEMKMTQVLIVVGNKYKVYSEANGKRKLLGVFKTSQDAIRFMNS
jgi:hypothetical protein